MKSKLVFPLLISALFISATICVNGSSGHRRMRSTTPRSVVASSKSFYFAVSGDSRDCGDLIMPRIAQSIERNRPRAPIEFYWHLGDLRAMLRIDCDIAKRTNPGFQCDPYKRTPTEISASEKTAYQEHAWDDFIEHQIALFGNIPFVLGVGNHELVERTRDDFRLKFRQWLTQPLLEQQRASDESRNITSSSGSTYFHFLKANADFIYLDNAGSDFAFSKEQIEWLSKVLSEDEKNNKVKAIIVGMHAALPYSVSRNHAMDATCPGICSGQRVYNMLYEAQKLGAPHGKRKFVYVLASHSHLFEQNIYDTPEHLGRVLPGWIIGTAGAEQYRDTIRYGYLQVELRPDGKIDPQFREVRRDDPPSTDGPGATELLDFCFEKNKHPPIDVQQSNCKCGAFN